MLGIYLKIGALKDWYNRNLNKIVFLLCIIVIFTLFFTYIPFFNVIFSPIIGILLAFISYYFLFSPSNISLVMIAFIALFIAFIGTLFHELSAFAEIMGEVLYILLIFIFINSLKEVKKKNGKD